MRLSLELSSCSKFFNFSYSCLWMNSRFSYALTWRFWDFRFYSIRSYCWKVSWLINFPSWRLLSRVFFWATKDFRFWTRWSCMFFSWWDFSRSCIFSCLTFCSYCYSLNLVWLVRRSMVCFIWANRSLQESSRSVFSFSIFIYTTFNFSIVSFSWTIFSFKRIVSVMVVFSPGIFYVFPLNNGSFSTTSWILGFIVCSSVSFSTSLTFSDFWSSNSNVNFSMFLWKSCDFSSSSLFFVWVSESCSVRSWIWFSWASLLNFVMYNWSLSSWIFSREVVNSVLSSRYFPSEFGFFTFRSCSCFFEASSS